MPKVIETVREVSPLIGYFIKNGGLNTVTGAGVTGLLPAIIEILNNPAVSQGVDQLSAGSKTGAIVGAVVIALRAGLGFYRTIRG